MRMRMFGALLLVLVMSATSAWAQAKVPGVTDTEVVIGATTPLSGPAAAWGTTALGAEAWAKYVNEQGGVHGRKIRVELKDDGYNPGRSVANVTEMKDSVFALVGLLGTAVLNANKDNVAEAKLPTIWPYGNPQVFAKQPREKLKYVFMVYPDYGDEGEFLVQQAAKLEKAKKVAVFFQNDDYGKGGLEGVKRGVKGLGGAVSIAAEVSYEVADRELGTHALKIKDSGADTVVFYSTVTHGANLIKEMAKVGYRPKIFASFPLGDRHTMFRLLGDLWEGAYYNVTGAVPGEPEADRIIEILLKQEPKFKGRESFALAGAVAMMATVEGLKRAGRNLTRENFIEAMESIKNWTPEKITAPITWGPNRRHGLNPIRMQRANKAADASFSTITGYQNFPSHF
ncbi:MAG: extracellular ligand-binding receptor [Candidatus Rokubacteria bacterium CSP1-6]|nr:MAG: extracellular ligand-binding receptor [Candidatus Rokubacteria bacterium CSP1-6]